MSTDDKLKRHPRKHHKRGLEMRENIIEASLEEFASRGFEAASTRRIATSLGIPHTLLLYYFQTKEQLWYHTVTEVYNPTANRIFEQIEQTADLDPMEALRHVYEDFVRFSAQKPQFHRLMTSEGREKTDRLEWLVGSYLKRHTDAFAGLVRRVQAAGMMPKGDPYKIVYMLIGAATNLFMIRGEFELVTGRSPLSKRETEEHVRMVMALFFDRIAAENAPVIEAAQ